MKPLMQFTEKENELLNQFYPPRTGELGDDGDPETGEWNWEGHEHDEIIPWTFSSHDGIDEEKFLVLYNTWMSGEDSTIDGQVLAFTSTDRFPPVKDSIHESYEYITLYRNKLWRVSININMAVYGVHCVQENLKHFKIEDIEVKVIGSYWDNELGAIRVD